MAKILLLNGPNLNLLGEREPALYGRTTLAEIETAFRGQVTTAGHLPAVFQSNHEGALVDWLHEQRPADFLVLNAAALTHTSVALRDAIQAIAVPCVEVHLSNVYRREAFRRHSYFSDIAMAIVAGMGPAGYRYAVDFALATLAEEKQGAS